MFTGIIHSTGKVKQIRTEPSKEGKGLSLLIGSRLKSVAVRESIAVNGVCLTVTGKKKGKSGWDFSAEISEETLKRTALEFLKEGQDVNLEQALRASDRLGGHFVQGHVDAVAEILQITPQGNSRWFTFSYPSFLEPYIIPKGSIAVDGVSLTIADHKDGTFSASVLPFTEENTSFGKKQTGDRVNLEADILAKIVAKQVRSMRKESAPQELYEKIELDWSALEGGFR